MKRGAVSGLVSGNPYGIARPIAYTPTVTWTGNTITTQSGFYLKTPGKLEVWVSFIESVGTATAAVSITIPSVYQAVTHTGSLATGVGTLFRSTGSLTVNYMLQIAAGATTTVTVNSAVGAVDTWCAYMSIPTLT